MSTVATVTPCSYSHLFSIFLNLYWFLIDFFFFRLFRFFYLPQFLSSLVTPCLTFCLLTHPPNSCKLLLLVRSLLKISSVLSIFFIDFLFSQISLVFRNFCNFLSFCSASVKLFSSSFIPFLICSDFPRPLNTLVLIFIP